MLKCLLPQKRMSNVFRQCSNPYVRSKPSDPLVQAKWKIHADSPLFAGSKATQSREQKQGPLRF